MARLTAFALSLTFVAATAGAQSPPVTDKAELEKLRGAWGTVRSTRDGKESAPEQGAKLVFDGDLVHVHERGRKEPVPMKINVGMGRLSVRPHDADPIGPPARTETAFRLTYGIYKVEGDELTLVLQSAFSIPKGFTDEKQVMWVLRREAARK
ncbi:hypothetical protein J0H58_25105 [bacterium]|nr:hypothetical protein [bacterium]